MSATVSPPVRVCTKTMYLRITLAHRGVVRSLREVRKAMHAELLRIADRVLSDDAPIVSNTQLLIEPLLNGPIYPPPTWDPDQLKELVDRAPSAPPKGTKFFNLEDLNAAATQLSPQEVAA